MLSKVLSYVQAIVDRDPAISRKLEVLLYPGLHALGIHTVAHCLYKHGFFFTARLLNMLSRLLTGIDIHPGADIGRGLFIDHGHGVVIGETAVIKDNVTLYQGVTLGATGKDKGKRHPTIEEDCVISAGAKVLGNIVVGTGSKVGAGAVVLHSVPVHATVVGIPAQIIALNGERVDPPIPLKSFRRN